MVVLPVWLCVPLSMPLPVLVKALPLRLALMAMSPAAAWIEPFASEMLIGCVRPVAVGACVRICVELP